MKSPRSGGIGCRFITVDSNGIETLQDAQFIGYKNASNNQMELKACTMALREAIRLKLTSGVSRVIIHTDSLYIVDHYKRAMFEWPKSQWNRRSGAPVLNAGLWKDLVKIMKKVGMRVEFEWVKGHSKNVHNRAADKMARQSAKIALNDPISVVHVRRKISSKSVERGSIRMQGQRISIHVITTEFLPVQKVWKCKYEVISKGSGFYSNVDIIFSKELIKAGHSYYVMVNKDTENPRVIKIFREVVIR